MLQSRQQLMTQEREMMNNGTGISIMSFHNTPCAGLLLQNELMCISIKKTILTPNTFTTEIVRSLGIFRCLLTAAYCPVLFPKRDVVLMTVMGRNNH